MIDINGTEFIQTADSARRLLRGFAAVKDVADAFEQVGSLQQANTEAQAQLAKAQADLATVKDELSTASSALAGVQALSVQTADEAQRSAATLVADAQTRAAEILAAADAEVVQIRAQGAAEADEMKGQCEEMDRALQAKQQEVAAIEQRVADAKAFLAKLGATA